MKLTKRLLALALSGVLMLGGLTACGKVAVTLPEYDPATLDTTTITDLTEFLMGVPGDTAIATLNGTDITADEFIYWIVAYCDNVQQNAYQSTGSLDIPWDADMGDGLTVESFIRKDALNLAVTQRMVEQMGEKEGFAMTKEQQDSVQQILDGIAAEGLQSGILLEDYLKLSMAAGEELFRWNWKCDYAYEALMLARFGGENAPADEDVLSWLEEEQGFYRVKHILINMQGITDEEEAKEKRALADSLLTQLLAAEDPIALFDQLMLEYGEDPGVASNPDGYTAYPGQMVAAFEAASLGLEIGSFSDVVTSDFGYHIILRLPLEVDAAQYKDSYIAAAMSQLVTGLVGQAKLKTTALCDELDVKDVYERMTAFRARYGQPAVEPEEAPAVAE